MAPQQALAQLAHETDREGVQDLESTLRAVLNILDDFNLEKTRVEETQRAVLNILDDFNLEKGRLESTQRAVLNILDDFNLEKGRLESTQRAVLNILDDFNLEKARLEDTQRAALNILEDLNLEKLKVEGTNTSLNNEIVERKRIEGELIKRTDQLESANKELEAFSYTVSHDLRAPLRAIDGFARILVEEHEPHLPEDAKRYLHLVRSNTQRMGNLVDDLLAFSRLSRQQITKSTVAPSTIIRQTLDELEEERKGRRVELTLGNMPPCQAEPSLLRQVWFNLLANALKFTRRCDVAQIEVGSRVDDGITVYFIRDNGVGFDMTYADKLFGVFSRLHRAEDYEGTGVGLAIIQRIITRHGGRVWVEAAVNQGATFYFTLEGGSSHG